MKIIRSIKKMSEFSRNARLTGKSIGFVPTMGALHEGHLSLIRCARRNNDRVVVSIFVNPIQFGPGEDFKKYPRNLKRDENLCRKEGTDVIFYPREKDFYPKGYKTYVNVEGLSQVLCGQFRPGHFQGVATVVTKLLNIVQPDIAYFGQKDAQQSIIIKRMVEDLNMQVKIAVLPTVREKDGLAMSSRNAYLSLKERAGAAALYKSLKLAKMLVKKRSAKPSDIIRQMRQLINKNKNVKLQYISVVDVENLRPLKAVKNITLIALAAQIGKTRLIDNIIINKNG